MACASKLFIVSLYQQNKQNMDAIKTFEELIIEVENCLNDRAIEYNTETVLDNRIKVQFKIGCNKIDLRIIRFDGDNIRFIFNDYYSAITGKYAIWDLSNNDISLTDFINETLNKLYDLEPKLTDAVEILQLAKTAFDELGIDISGLTVGELLPSLDN